MQHKSRKDKNGKTFADKVLEQYISYISEEVYEQYGLGKKDSDIIGTNAQKNAWMVLHNWDDAKEKFVIERTKTYIRTLDSTDSNSTNLQFIKALVNRIVAYLSVFCQNGPNRTIKSAKEMLGEVLFSLVKMTSHLQNGLLFVFVNFLQKNADFSSLCVIF